MMKKIETPLPDVFLLEPNLFGDERGFFMETYNARVFAELGLHATFVQDNHSKSARGVLRGMHLQKKNPQTKLCRVIRGAVWDVALDLRPESATFGQWFGAVLSAQNKRQMWIPRGFAHGFLTLENDTEFLYKCDDFYAPGDEVGVAWNDESAAIAWPLEEFGIEMPILSAKDRSLLSLNEARSSLAPIF